MFVSRIGANSSFLSDQLCDNLVRDVFLILTLIICRKSLCSKNILCILAEKRTLLKLVLNFKFNEYEYKGTDLSVIVMK